MLRCPWLLLGPLVGLLITGCRNAFVTVRADSSARAAVAAPQRDRPLQLTDVTGPSGVHFQHTTGASGRKWFPETNGSGAAIFDYDGDGFADLFLVNGREWSSAERGSTRHPNGAPSTPSTSHLYRNKGDGTFEDVTRAAGLDLPMYGMGCAAGDYNNDGCPDLYVSGVGRGWLFRNEGGKRFREVAAPSRVQGDGWSTSCAWVDIDRDGFLDLFVCHYVNWNPRNDAPCQGEGGRPVYCGPNLYHPEPCRLYRNRRDGTFTDISQQAGIRTRGGSPLTSKAMGVTVCDVDEDGWPDLAVANDTEANFLFRNNHDRTFTEQGLTAGMALPEGGQARSGMGIDAADWDGSGRDSLLIGNFWDEMLALYHPGGHGLYTDKAASAGLGEPSRAVTTFGCLFVDLDNDGWLDVAAADGHIDEKAEQGAHVPLRQRPLFLLNQAGKSFRDAHLYDHALVGRGLAAGDWNRDGAVDLLLTTNGGAPVLLQNSGVGQSVRLVLEGTRSNRSGIGAEIIARVGERVLRRRVHSGSSYLSASELAVTLGIGAARQADRITVRWPSGAMDELHDLAAGNEFRVREGRGIVRVTPLRGLAGG
jgi:hypothetical protein